MPETALVTIVIPTYNAARWLGEAVESALAQTHENLEILVLDNGSTDNTPELMRAHDDPRLTYDRIEENIGFAGNVTRGIRAATGDYFMVLGADDILEPGFVAAAVARLEAAPGAEMLHGGAIWIDDDGKPIGAFNGNWPARSSGDDAFIRAFTEGFCYSCVISRTAPVKALGAMDEGWGMISDSWLFLRLCLLGDVLFLEEPLVRYRVRETSLSFRLYADGSMFDDHLAGLEEAFSWPEAAHLRPRIREARRAIARQAFDTLHMTRLGAGLSGTLRKAAMVARAEPGILLSPGAWMRFIFATLPPSLINALRTLRRKRRKLALAARNVRP